jgi:hypothetical protein
LNPDLADEGESEKNNRDIENCVDRVSNQLPKIPWGREKVADSRLQI